MNRTIINSRVGADGVLQVQVPLGASEANRDVRLTIEPAEQQRRLASDYATWLRSVAGQWQGEFERPPHGALEERQPLS